MSLQVGPAVLRRGATELLQHHERLADALSSIHSEHTNLQVSWSGRAADHVNSVWTELHPRLASHIGRLSIHAAGLSSAADGFLTQDDRNAAPITSAISSLDLP